MKQEGVLKQEKMNILYSKCSCKQSAAGSNVLQHSWANDHTINSEDGQVIDRGNYRTRKTLESWHTAITAESDNN